MQYFSALVWLISLTLGPYGSIHVIANGNICFFFEAEYLFSCVSVCVCGVVYQCVCVCVYIHVLSCFSHVQLCATLWTVVCQTLLSMGILQARILK